MCMTKLDSVPYQEDHNVIIVGYINNRKQPIINIKCEMNEKKMTMVRRREEKKIAQTYYCGIDDQNMCIFDLIYLLM